MKKYIPPFLYLVLFLFCFLFKMVEGQPLSYNLQSPQNLTVCGRADTFSVSYTNIGSDTLKDPIISVVLPQGFRYVNNSIISGQVNELNTNNADSVVLQANDIKPTKTQQFQFLVRASCPAIDNADSVFQNTLYFSFTSGKDTITSPPYNIEYPSLNITSVSKDSATLGDTITRSVTITNGGDGSVNTLFFSDISDTNNVSLFNFRLSPSNASITPSSQGDSVIMALGSSDFQTIGNGNGQLEKNESVTIAYDIHVKECIDNKSELLTWWGCDQQLCQVDNRLTDIIVPNPTPDLDVQHEFTPNTCYSDNTPSVGKIIVTNNGAGPARDFTLDVAQSNGSGFGNANGYYSGFDTSAILWKANNGNADTLSPIYTRDAWRNCLAPEMKSWFKIQVPKIAPGETDTLVYYQYTCCSQSCNSNRMLSTKYRFEYNDQCFDNTYNGGPTTLNYYWHRSDNINQLFHNGPTDILPGDTATFTITHSRWRFVTPKAPGSYFQTQFILPSGISFTGNPNDIWLINQFGNVFTPSNFTQNGDTVTVQYPLGFQFNPEKAETHIRLVADCGATGPGSFTANIQYKVNVVPDTSCACTLCAASHNFNVDVHCPPVPCPDGGMVSLDYENERHNYGIADNPDDGVADSSQALNKSQVRTQFLMFGDTMYTQMTGVVDTSATNPDWQYGSLESRVSQGQYLDFLADSIRIVDASTGTIYKCGLPPPTTQTNGGDKTFSYNIDVGNINCLPAGFRYEKGDTVQVIAYYQSKRNGGVVQTQDIENIYSLSPILL
ncbi:MAG: hypothetical protein BRD50_00225 [Bacteroidetes bacterium SW_11_45_7]|nr:MAG: hypothetical protein BRD50_00225 [Bacteroidetes bacterium SW_11_45_7]